MDSILARIVIRLKIALRVQGKIGLKTFESVKAWKAKVDGSECRYPK